MEKAPADYIHSSGDTPPPRLSARSLHAVCTLSAQICTNLHEIYTNLHLSELDKAGYKRSHSDHPRSVNRMKILALGECMQACIKRGGSLCAGDAGRRACLRHQKAPKIMELGCPQRFGK